MVVAVAAVAVVAGPEARRSRLHSREPDSVSNGGMDRQVLEMPRMGIVDIVVGTDQKTLARTRSTEVDLILVEVEKRPGRPVLDAASTLVILILDMLLTVERCIPSRMNKVVGT